MILYTETMRRGRVYYWKNAPQDRKQWRPPLQSQYLVPSSFYGERGKDNRGGSYFVSKCGDVYGGGVHSPHFEMTVKKDSIDQLDQKRRNSSCPQGQQVKSFLFYFLVPSSLLLPLGGHPPIAWAVYVTRGLQPPAVFAKCLAMFFV